MTPTLPRPFSQDVDENNCYRHPKLYIAGQKNLSFNTIIFLRSLVKGIYVAIILFFVLLGITAFDNHPDGYEWDYQSFGLAASCALTIIVNFQVSFLTRPLSLPISCLTPSPFP